MFDRYTFLHIRIFLTALRKGKITLRKIWNAVRCELAYRAGSEMSGPSPMVLSLELGNECNVNCLFCRDEKGRIPDTNPNGVGTIAKGRMRLDVAESAIDALADDALIAVLFTNGEPLTYPDLFHVARFASSRRLASMIATNGTLLNEKACREILDSGIDFVKVAVSGWNQTIHSVQARFGDVEKIRENIARLAAMNREWGNGLLIMVDYILYSYNRHEVPLVQKFCRDMGIMMSLRPGNPRGGLEDRERPLNTGPLPLKLSCDWLWKGVQVDWTGDIQHCCECGLWSGTRTYGRLEAGRNLRDIWNGLDARDMRRRMKMKGRFAEPVCSMCLRKGLSFKW